MSWIALFLAIFGVIGTWVVAVVAWVQAKYPAQHITPQEGGPRIITFAPKFEPEADWDTRVGHVVDMMTNQDTITWAVAAISFAAQAALAGFYFQTTTNPSGRIALPVVGVFVAFVLLLFVARSNWYMAGYMNLLRRTGREEFHFVGPRRLPPSSTYALYGVSTRLSRWCGSSC